MMHTMSMSRCSSTVLTVYGMEGLVEDGSTFGSEHTVMMSGACPPYTRTHGQTLTHMQAERKSER
jgi:hypothetical protein